ncbi:MAG: hydroxymethylbilane synthase [Ferruginibacter sp.]
MQSIIKIGTRESELAVWQATLVQNLLKEHGYPSELVFIKSEGDIDLQTPLYEMGVQGIFTRSLDIALLNQRIDIAVHSMKDVPTQLPEGLTTAAILKRGNHKDLLVFNEWNKDAGPDNDQLIKDNDISTEDILFHTDKSTLTIASSSIRRKAQWLHRYPHHRIENLRGNVNTRLQKVKDSTWNAAIFAAAGLERIQLRPKSAIDLNWMLPSPAQGAITIVTGASNVFCKHACEKLHDPVTEQCTRIERDFLRTLMGGCSTPIGALAVMDKNEFYFKGNILSPDGKEKIEIERFLKKEKIEGAGATLANEILANGGKEIADKMQKNG